MITEHIKAHHYRDPRTLSSIKLKLFRKLTKINYEKNPKTIFTFGLSTPNRAVQYTSVIKDLNGIIPLILNYEKNTICNFRIISILTIQRS